MVAAAGGQAPKAPSPPQELGIANPRAARVWIPSLGLCREARLPYWLFLRKNFTILAFFNSLWLGKFEFGFFLKFGLFLAFLKVVFSFQKFHCPGVYGRNNVPF